MRSTLPALFALSLICHAGCAAPRSAPATAVAVRPPTLQLAEQAVAQAKAGPASQLGGPSMHAAEHELNKAERKARHNDLAGAEAHAYDALRAAQAAGATAGLAMAQHEGEQHDPKQAAEKGARALTEPLHSQQANDAETMALATRLRSSMPRMVAEPADHGGLCLTLASDLAFRGNTAVISPAARRELNRLARVLAEAHGAQVQILGRVPGTVMSPKASRLAEARTHSVVAHLLSRGVAESRVVPIAPKHDEPTSARRGVVDENVDGTDLHIVIQTQPPLPARSRHTH